MTEPGLQRLRWRRLLLAGLLGGLLALCLHAGSRSFLLTDQIGTLRVGREAERLPSDDQGPVAITLWLERAASTQPNRDDLLSLYEAVEAKTREEPRNAAWWRSAAWVQWQLGNQDRAREAWKKAMALGGGEDYRGSAADFHVAQSGAGPRAWRKLDLLLSWPLSDRDRRTARALDQVPSPRPPVGTRSVAAVVAASLPGALLATSLCLAMAGGVSWLVLRSGVLPRLADGWPVFGAAVIAGLTVFWFTRLTATSLWVSLVLASFGVFRDRILHHSRRSGRDDWVHLALLGAAAALLTTGFVCWGTAARELGEHSSRVAQMAESAPSLVQGAAMVASLSVAVSLVRAYLGRVEPVVEAFGNLQHVGGRLAVAFAALTLFATPACMAWDGAMADAMAKSTPGQAREP